MLALMIALSIASTDAPKVCPLHVQVCSEAARQCVNVPYDEARLEPFRKRCEQAGEERGVKGCLYRLIISGDMVHLGCGPAEAAPEI